MTIDSSNKDTFLFWYTYTQSYTHTFSEGGLSEQQTSPLPQWSRFLESQQAAKMQCKESYFSLRKSTNFFYIASITQIG